jgi:ribosomal protein L19
MLTKALF